MSLWYSSYYKPEALVNLVALDHKDNSMDSSLSSCCLEPGCSLWFIYGGKISAGQTSRHLGNWLAAWSGAVYSVHVSRGFRVHDWPLQVFPLFCKTSAKNGTPIFAVRSSIDIPHLPLQAVCPPATISMRFRNRSAAQRPTNPCVEQKYLICASGENLRRAEKQALGGHQRSLPAKFTHLGGWWQR